MLSFQYEIFNTQMLAGSDLIDKVKELADYAKTDPARDSGYVVIKKDDKEQL